MADTVGKPAEDFAGAPNGIVSRELRLASDDCLNSFADRSPIIRNLLSAVDKALHLAEEDPSARRYLDKDIDNAMPRMVDEIMFVRVWNASQLHVAVDRLSLPMNGESLMAFPNDAGSMSTCDRTTTTGTVSTGMELDASDGIQCWASSSVPDEVAALMDGGLESLDLICPAGLSILHEIAQRVIRAGYTKQFLEEMEFASCDVLDGFLSILKVEWPRRRTEIWIKRWSTVAKLVEKAVVAMRRQLYAQDSGAFDNFRDKYLLIIAERRVLHLLRYANEFTTDTMPENLVYIILGMYEALSDAAPSLLILFRGARKQRVSERTQNILAKLADVVKTRVSGFVAKIQSYPWHTQSLRPVGVREVTQYTMTCVELLAPHRTVLGLILATGGVDAPAGGAERVTSFGSLVEMLVEALERNLRENSVHLGGLVHLFLANNLSFVLNRAADANVLSLLGDEWAARRRSQLERHAASYVEAWWIPVVACLETAAGGMGKPAKALAKFSVAFKRAHDNQGWCQVPDPTLRAALRMAVTETVVPAYTSFLQKHPKLEKSVIYSVDHLAELLSELFEG